jgi:hypothetical protein
MTAVCASSLLFQAIGTAEHIRGKVGSEAIAEIKGARASRFDQAGVAAGIIG